MLGGHSLQRWWFALALVATPLGCSDDAGKDPETAAAAATGDPCHNPGTDGATATCSKPTQTPSYYVAQAEAYFDTLDIDAPADSVPDYAALVVRWEWPPWLLLTGYTAETMIATGKLLKKADPSRVPKRDCRFFPVQPFARCRVEFEYEGGPCPIYEEFVFNDAGQMTFIEAWSDLPALVPTTADDLWGERSDIGRLSTRVPGLGKADGRIDLESSWMTQAAGSDKDVAELQKRARDQWMHWAEELANAPADFFAKGCGW